MDRGLASLQAWFFERITRGASSGDDARSRIPGGDDAFVRARLSIYSDAYFARLLDVLRDDYPCVAGHLGERTFRSVVRDFLGKLPSRNPSLRHVGADFAPFLRGHPCAERAPWLPDLAALEWARVEVFDRANEAALVLEDLANVAAERWPSLVFGMAPWVRIVRTSYPVQRAWRGLEDGAAAPDLPREPTTLVVWRRDLVVRHRAAPPDEARALVSLAAGAPFSQVCDAYAELASGDLETAARSAFTALRQWVVDGLIAAVR
jgi:hypothetical protein